MFKRDSRLFVRSLKYIIIIGCILLAGAAGTIFMIINDDAGGSKPLTLALVNEDQESTFADLVLNIVAENENIASSVDVVFFKSEEEAVKAVKNGAAAALIIPDDFFGSVYQGENYPCRIVLNNSNKSSARTIRYFAGLGSDMLSSAQYAIYEGDLYLARKDADDKTREDYNVYLNMKMVSEAAEAPDRYFDVFSAGYTASGLPKTAHYIALFMGFFFGIISICFFHLYRDDFRTDRLTRLFASGVSRAMYIRWKILLPGALFLIITILVFVFGGRFVEFNASPAALLPAFGAAAFAAAFCGLFGTAIGDLSGAVIFIIFFVSLFFCGGIIPYSNLTALTLKAGSFTPLGVIYGILSPAFGGRFELSALIAGAAYIVLGVWMFKNALDRTLAGRGNI